MSRPKITLLIASSIDGRIALPCGGESHLGSIEDKKILNNALSGVDATIFGSGTLKAHKSTFLVRNYSNDQILAKSNQPISIVAGNPNHFSYDWQFFKQPIKRWLLNSNSIHLVNKENFEKEFLFKKNLNNVLKILYKEGLHSIALMGGTKLIYSFALENLIDEIKLTIVPKIIGGKYSWIPDSKENLIFNYKQEWRLLETKELETNEIYLHYSKI